MQKSRGARGFRLAGMRAARRWPVVVVVAVVEVVVVSVVVTTEERFSVQQLVAVLVY